MELLTSGYTAFGAKKFEESIAAYQRFQTEYGKSAEAAQALPQILPILAQAQIRLQKWPDAATTIETYLTSHAAKAAPKDIEDMRFWDGVCDLMRDETDTAKTKLQTFLTQFPQSARMPQARMLYGSTLIKAEDYKASAAYFQKVQPQLRGSTRGQAVLLELYSQIKDNKSDEALKIIVREYPKLEQILPIAGFEMLVLQLGSDYLEKKEYRKALAAFQRIWSRGRILKHQSDLKSSLESQLAAAIQKQAEPFTIFQIQQDLKKIQQDLDVFSKIPTFDSSLRLRVASAYQGMERYREAALVLEQMLQEMEPDSVVEAASVNLVQCWAQIEYWSKTAEAADNFTQVFPKSKQLPSVLFLKGQALLSEYKPADAADVFGKIVVAYPKDSLAPRALFMQGYSQLVADQADLGIATLESFPKKYPKDPLEETAFYWRGMGYSLSKQHEEARTAMSEYLSRYKGGSFVSEARFRKAYDAESMKAYELSIPELRAFLKDFPDSQERDETLILLGDANMAIGKIDEGIEAFNQISPTEKRFFEEGWFKTAKALRLQEKPTEMRAHLEKFCKDFPKSPRIAEALYWIGWSWRQEGAPDKARDIYWQAIRDLGNDPDAVAVEDLLTGVAKLYKGDEEKAKLLSEYRTLQAQAETRKETLLVLRSKWAQAQALKRSDPTTADQLLVQCAPMADVSEVNPLLLADIADALRRSGKTPEAAQMYRDLVKWNPRAMQKDRSFAALGQIALVDGRDDEALTYFQRFQKETAGSPMFGEILLAKSGLEVKKGDLAAAQATLEAILSDKTTPGKIKAETLASIGDLQMQQGKTSGAIPYYQKIYIMYGRWSSVVARAYLQSGEAFEKLKDRDAAIKTYKEMIDREELAEFAETKQARERLAKLEAGA